MTKLSDCWQTPDWLFKELSEKYGPFDIDLTATKENSKCDGFYIDYLNNIYNRPTIINYVRTDEKLLLSLKQIYEGDDDHFGNENIVAWMNPPYSNPLPFIQKAWEDSRWCKIVLLVKVDTSTKWWKVFFDHGIKPNTTDHQIGERPGCKIIYLPKRIKFDPPAKCKGCNGAKFVLAKTIGLMVCPECELPAEDCFNCNGTGKKKLSGPSFSSAVIIMDRRGLV